MSDEYDPSRFRKPTPTSYTVTDGITGHVVTTTASSFVHAAELVAELRAAQQVDQAWPVELTVSNGEFAIRYRVARVSVPRFIASKVEAR